MANQDEGRQRKNGRTIPLAWQVVGRLLRAIPHFRGKWLISNMLCKQIRGRGYSTTIRFDRGERVALYLDDWIPYQVFLTGLYAAERAHTRLFRRLVREGMVVLDIGANIGYYTLQAAARVGSEGRVHAFEPVGETFERLTENIRLNGFQNVFANRCIVHERHGTMEIFVADKSNTGRSSLSPVLRNYSGRVENVESISIDSYIEQKGMRDVDLVKIDVEGSELSVLKGMRKLLGRSKLQLLIEIEEELLESQGAGSKELFEYLESFGFYPSKIVGGEPVEIREGAVCHESLVLFRKRESGHG